MSKYIIIKVANTQIIKTSNIFINDNWKVKTVITITEQCLLVI